jgi:hypothetical protein
VFEADFGNARWLEVKYLCDQALFLGRISSMAIATAPSEICGQRFRGGNSVFGLCTSLRQLVSNKYIPSYCVYVIMSGKTSILSLGGAPYMEHCTPEWFFLKKISNKYKTSNFYLV